MRRRLVVVNLVLAAAVAATGWRLHRIRVEARSRHDRVLGARPRVDAAAAGLSAPRVQPVVAAAYLDVAQKLLFSKDRNPTVVVDAAPPKPMPPLPVAYGVMTLGDAPTAWLGEKPGAPHRGVRVGDKMGEFRLVSISALEITFEWDGQKIVKKLEELMVKDRGGIATPEAPAAAAPKPADASSTVITPAAKAGPGIQLTPEIRGCQPGDTSPSGTVVDGMRKVVTTTPFGQSCRWELVK